MSTPTTPDGNRGDTPSKSGLHPWLGRESRLSAWIRRHDFYPLIRVQLTIGAWAFVIASGALVWAWAAEDLVRPTLALVLAAALGGLGCAMLLWLSAWPFSKGQRSRPVRRKLHDSLTVHEVTEIRLSVPEAAGREGGRRRATDVATAARPSLDPATPLSELVRATDNILESRWLRTWRDPRQVRSQPQEICLSTSSTCRRRSTSHDSVPPRPGQGALSTGRCGPGVPHLGRL